MPEATRGGRRPPGLRWRKTLAGAGRHSAGMAKKFPVHPAQPQRVCWGCDLYCASESLRCGNGSVRTPHPSELFGEDWEQALPVTPWPGDAATAQS